MKKLIPIAPLLSFSFFLVFIITTFTACQSNDTFEMRRQVAKEMLKKKFDVVVNVSTEFIRKKHPVIAFGVELLASSKCDCITDSLSIQFANEYSLERLQELQNEPIQSLQITIEKILDEDDHAVINCIKKLQ